MYGANHVGYVVSTIDLTRAPKHKRLSLKVGGFVLAPDGFGIGKLLSAEGGVARVQFLHSIAFREERTYPFAALTRGLLYPQTRVYVREEEGDVWRMGRVRKYFHDQGVLSYEVQLPNDRTGEYTEEQLEVRCLRPNLDPTEVLAWGGAETQFFHDRRRAALGAILQARADSRGLTGLLSAAVDLVPHQIEVVRRVLEDPIQRYLLADEVGMGKTIEAGAVIRQCLLDSADERVLVLTPAQLLRQWRRELRDKFTTDDFGGRVHVRAFEELADVAVGAYGLVVVDEAHHLIPELPDGDAIYSMLARLAHDTPRLLLLTATPALGHEGAMLALLHLLDPDTYRLEDSESFARKVASRQEIGRLLLALNPGANAFILRQTARLLLEVLADDPVVAKLARTLGAAAGVGDRSAIEATVRELKSHVAETYRLHQRLLRTRRKDTQGWELRARGGRIPTIDADEDSRIPDLAAALEDWAYRSRQTVDESRSETAGAPQAHFARRYADLFEAFGRGPEELGLEVERQWALVQRGELATFDEERDIVGALREVLAQKNEFPSRLEVALGALQHTALGVQGAPVKVVAFTSSTAFARQLVAQITRTRGRDAVCNVLGDVGPDAVEHELARFERDPRATFMVCDREGEEGLNFAFAQAVVHLDLPLSAARLEQRMGRLDRYGRRDRHISQRIVLPSDEDDSPWLAWFELLRHGFGIFDGSISEVQFLLQRLETEIVLTLYREGAGGLRGLVHRVQEELARERERLDEQYALDRLEMGEDAAGLLFEEFEQAEAEEAPFARALDSWLFGVLQLGREQLRDLPGGFRMHWTPHTLAPEVPWHGVLQPGLQRPLSYRRYIATHHPEVALVRPGFPMIDNLQTFMRWDDRGTAFATWRVAPGWRGGIWLGFKLCYVVELDAAAIREQLGGRLAPELEPNLRRRADALLPPWIEVLYLDTDLCEVEDPELLNLLGQPYEPHGRRVDEARDFNLGSRRDWLLDAVGQKELADLTRQVRARSEELLRASAHFVEQTSAAARLAVDEMTGRNWRLANRRAATQREGGRVEQALERETAINRAIGEVVGQPTVRLDAIGLFVIADRPPAGT